MNAQKDSFGTNHLFCLHYLIPIIYSAREEGTSAPDYLICRHRPSQSGSVMGQR